MEPPMIPPPMITTSRVISLELTDLFYQWGRSSALCGATAWMGPARRSIKGWRAKGLRYIIQEHNSKTQFKNTIQEQRRHSGEWRSQEMRRAPATSRLLKRFDEFVGEDSRFFGEVAGAHPIFAVDGFVGLREEVANFFDEIVLRFVELLAFGDL